ncbi:unnamed protein product [Blepharisma stoltei]|uniref:C2H2-type domain-containing protein n=1 Tax=Blepharisma stoltei TaxID=1481888 RepID=A0AAU9J8Z7_9CILI|nr:unnamed protein product [Blepharisma stoltei]
MEEFRCSYPGCDHRYSTKFNLNRHVKVCHVGVRFECDECDRKLSSAQNLQDHMYVHTGEKPYACKARGCKKRYRQISQLSVHRKKHRANKAKMEDLFVELKIKIFIDDKCEDYKIPLGPFTAENSILPPLLI